MQHTIEQMKADAERLLSIINNVPTIEYDATVDEKYNQIVVHRAVESSYGNSIHHAEEICKFADLFGYTPIAAVKIDYDNPILSIPVFHLS